MLNHSAIPEQKVLKNTISALPVEYFKWGTSPDHFKIDMPHRHNFVEILFFKKGSGIHEIDFEEHKIHDNSIHIVPKSTIHFLKRGLQSSGFTIAFDPTFLDSNEIHKIISPIQNTTTVLNLSAENFNHLTHIADLLLHQSKLSKFYFKRKCFLLSLELLLNATANKSNASNSLTKRKDLWLQTFNNLVAHNVHQQRSVSWYAQELNLSPKSLSNQFKLKSGSSAKKFITEQLLKSVKKQLIHSNKSIKAIAHDHHLSVSSLAKVFKKNVKVTMQEYKSD